METFDEHLAEMMEDSEFAREYEALQPERELMMALGSTRAASKNGMEETGCLMLAASATPLGQRPKRPQRRFDDSIDMHV